MLKDADQGIGRPLQLIFLSVIAHTVFLTPTSPFCYKVPFSLMFAAFIVLYDWMQGLHNMAFHRKESNMVEILPSVIAEVVPSLTVLLQNPTTDPNIYWKIVDLVSILEAPFKKYKLQYAHLVKFYAPHDSEGNPIPDPSTGEIRVAPENWAKYEKDLQEYDRANIVQIARISIPRKQIVPVLIKAHILNLRHVIDFVDEENISDEQKAENGKKRE